MKHRGCRFAYLGLIVTVTVTVTVTGCGATGSPAPDSMNRTVRLAPETAPERHYAARTPRPSAVTSAHSASPAIADPGEVAVQFVIDSQRCDVDAAAARALRDHAAPAVAERAIRDAEPGLDSITPRTITVTVTDTAMLDTDESRSRRRYRVTFDRTVTGPDGVSSVTPAMSLNVALDRISDRWIVSQVTAAAN